MNKDRRERLRDITSYIDDAITDMEDIKDEEIDAYDSLPESLQDSSRGDKMQGYISEIDDMVDQLANISEAIMKMCQ